MANSKADFQSPNGNTDETMENVDLAAYITKQKNDMKVTANQFTFKPSNINCLLKKHY